MSNAKRKVVDIFTRKPIETQNSMKDDIKEALQEAKGHAQGDEDTEERRKPRKSGSSDHRGPGQINISVRNNSGNVVGSVGDNAKFISKTTKIVKGPAPDTIGANDHLVRIINDEIKKLVHTRIKDWVRIRRYPNEEAARGPAYTSVSDGLRGELGIPHRDKRRIDYIFKELNVNRFDEIMEYLREKYSATITGKIKGGVRKAKNRTPFYALMQAEGALLEKIGLKADSPEVYDALRRYYGVTSHKHLETGQHKDWISRLEHIVDAVERGGVNPRDIRL